MEKDAIINAGLIVCDQIRARLQSSTYEKAVAYGSVLSMMTLLGLSEEFTEAATKQTESDAT